MPKRPTRTNNNEPFEFGHGPAQYSHMHAYLPTGFDNTIKSICLIGTSVIDSTNDIPLLGSNRLLEKLQAIVDLGRGTVSINGLSSCSIEVPIHAVNGHLAVKIASFPDHVHSFFEVWNALGKLTDEHNADVELIRTHDQLKSNLNSNIKVAQFENATTAEMAPSMASLLAGALPCRSPSRSGDDECDQVADPPESLVGPSRSTVDGGKEPSTASCHVGMRAPDHAENRQQARKVQQMPDVREKVEMGPRLGTMGGSTFKNLASAAAFTVLLHGSNLLGQQAYTGIVNGPGGSQSPEQQGTGYQVLSQAQECTQNSEEDHQTQRSGGRDVRGFRLERVTDVETSPPRT